MSKPRLISKILHIGLTTYYKYVKNDVKIIKFLQSFDREDLEELNERGMISSINFSLELLDEISEFQKYKFLNNSKDFEKLDDYFILFYFDFLNELKKGIENKSNINNDIFSSNFYKFDFDNIFLLYFNYFNIVRADKNDTKKILLKTDIIYKNSKIFFKDWDRNTLYFLYFSLKNNFLNLYNLNKDKNLDKKIIIWHIVGLNVFNLDLSDELKLKKINEYMSKFNKLPSSAKVLNSLPLILKKIDIEVK